MLLKYGRFISSHKFLILILTFILLIPAGIGFISTRINYDVLSYLPDSLETVAGQDIMVDEFGMGAFSMIVVEDMENKDVVELKRELEGVNGVKKVIWYNDVLDINIPTQMLPDKIKNALFKGDATMMIALFKESTSSDNTMDAIEEMRGIVRDRAFISGMSGVVTDIKNLALSELPVYVVVASLLSLIVLIFMTDSFLTPFVFLMGIGVAVVFNMGTNIVFGEISYLTQALTAILQLGVTMDYSIFLLESYETNKKKYDSKTDAMADALKQTFQSITGSSITTIAGFIALCFMTFKLGGDLGLVMAKGVIVGVIVCLTFLPAMILVCDKGIEKTTHRPLVPKMKRGSKIIVKLWPVALALFLVLLGPAIYGNSNYEIYYNITSSLPEDLDSAKANAKLQEDFNMNSTHLLLLKKGMSQSKIVSMNKEMEKVEGVKWTLGINTLVGENLPLEIVPKKYLTMLQSDDYEIEFVCSEYKEATKEANEQIGKLNSILKKYSKESSIIGEAPLSKDLEDVTNVDLEVVNIVSVIAIFIIILFVFKSISIPVILVSVIEFAIFINMAIPYFMGESLPFVASIVIGTIQLGATVDYAILMTSKYHTYRLGKTAKRDAILFAHRDCMKSVMTSGLSMFAATIGVAISSKIDMIKSICILLARGAIISTVVVIVVLPAMLMIFDKVICKTTWDMRKIDY